MNVSWQTFCYQMNSGTYHSEAEIEERFSAIMDMLFGWHKLEDKLMRQVPVPVGHETKKADIVLYRDRKPFVIEMKGPGIVPHNAAIDQLKSYMKILGSEYGLIANNKEMWLYFSAFSSPVITPFAHIPYDKDNPDGSTFASLMMYDSFSAENLDAFRKEKMAASYEAEMTENLIGRLLNTEDCRRLLADALLGLEEIRSLYSENAVKTALGKLHMTKDAAAVPPFPKPNFQPEKGFTGFNNKGLPIGTVVTFRGDNSLTATVAGDKALDFEGKIYKLSALARVLYTRIGKVTSSGAYQGALHFLYHGVPVLNLPDKT